METDMANTVGKFDYDDIVHGLRFKAVSQTLSAGCLTEGEIDEYRDMLKADLDAVAKRMKAALKKRPTLIELRNA